VINDINGELINFYNVVKFQFSELQTEIHRTLHSRRLHEHAWLIYNYPELFDKVKRAWAVWVLCQQSYAAKIDGAWGFDLSQNTTSTKLHVSRTEFTEQYARRLEGVQLENADALYIIRSRDSADSFFYCDPPYFNSNMGHYKGYTQEDFRALLQTLQHIAGKFLLSSYPSDLLDEFTRRNNWHQQQYQMLVTVNIKNGNPKQKTEVLTANYPLVKNNQLLLFDGK
jgi:DNA adenine methylase